MCVTINKITRGNIVFVIPVRINYTRTRQYAKSPTGTLRNYGLGVFFTMFTEN